MEPKRPYKAEYFPLVNRLEGQVIKISPTSTQYVNLSLIHIYSPTTRVLIHEKSSLAPPGQSLAFSLGDEKGFELSLIHIYKVCIVNGGSKSITGAMQYEVQ